jgi:hypothetical protein
MSTGAIVCCARIAAGAAAHVLAAVAGRPGRGEERLAALTSRGAAAILDPTSNEASNENYRPMSSIVPRPIEASKDSER